MSPFCPRFRDFLNDPSGAVTVDWVLLTASVVGLGLGAAASVRSGVGSLGTGIQTSLSGASVADLRLTNYTFRSMSYDIGGNWNNLTWRENQVATASNDDLATWWTNNGQQRFEAALVNGNDSICEGCFGAGNRLDLMRLVLGERDRQIGRAHV